VAVWTLTVHRVENWDRLWALVNTAVRFRIQ